MINSLLKNLIRSVILFIPLLLEGCYSSYKLPLVVGRKESAKELNGFVISNIDSTTFAGNICSVTISKYKKGIKNGISYQYLIMPHTDSTNAFELYHVGKFKKNKRRGIWWYYENGKKKDWEYWGRKNRIERQLKINS